jgi:ZIP family zinc transporter
VDPSAATWFAVMLLALLSGITTLIGVGLALWVGSSAKGIATGMGFSAGIMILISILELIPESVSEAGILGSLITVALGAAAVASLHVIVPHTHLIEEKGKLDPRLLKGAYLVAFGLILHDFPEGFAMANSYVASPSLGVLVALAIALHNIPEEFAMAAPAARKTLTIPAAYRRAPRVRVPSAPPEVRAVAR